MVKRTGCQCFTCRHSDEPRVLAGYLQGYIDASNWFLNWAKEMGIESGSIDKNDLPGIIAQMQCNRDESSGGFCSICQRLCYGNNCRRTCIWIFVRKLKH